jgi:hypothetical protein
MRTSGFVVLVFCLLSVATAGDAAASAFGSCSCMGTEQGGATRSGYWTYRGQQARARQVYRAHEPYRAREIYRAPNRAVAARRGPYQQAPFVGGYAPYQQAQAPRYMYGGGQVLRRQAVQYRASRAQQLRARQVYRTRHQPVEALHAQRQPGETERAQQQPVVAADALHQEAKASRYAMGGGEIIQHPAGCPVRLFCGCGASIEVFGHSVRDLWLVSNWYRFPRAAPAAGMAVLWGTHHVAVIRQYFGDGTALLYDANSGKGLTRVHRIRIAGLAVVDPHPGQASMTPAPSSLMLIL